MSKIDNIKRFFPSLYKPFLNTYIKALLETIGQQDENVSEQIQNAKEQIFVATAIGNYLDVLGSNVGVERPIQSTSFYVGDSLYRSIIPILSYYPKQVRDTMNALLEAFFGTNPEVFIKEVNPNEVVVQLPANLSIIRGNLRGATHFHQEEGYIAKVDNVLKTITVNFENHLNQDLGDFTRTTKMSVYNGASSNLQLAAPRIAQDKGSIQIDKAGIVSSLCGVDVDFQHYPLDLSSDKYISYWMYITDPTNVTGVALELHTDSDSSYWLTSKNDAGLQSGWNLVNFDITSTPDATTGSGVDLENVSKISMVLAFSSFGQTLSGIKFSKLYSTSSDDLFYTNEFAGMTFAMDGEKAEIVSHNSGSSDIVLQFGMSEDLSVFFENSKFFILNENWPGDFIFHPSGPGYSIREPRATLGQTITAGASGALTTFVSTSEIPDTSGYLVFNHGQDNEEYLVPYLEVIDGVSIIIDPSYTFIEDHSPGEVVNVVTSGALEPDDDGTDFAIYNTATDALVPIVDDLLNLLKATGVVIRFITKV